ncbi:2-hydroxy-acid oxidase [Lysinibacillus contaminans]|uniref:D-lactate dehydrogenase (cytochrome) n=1 Tax=Lysinibacillus contaminans TaxID=1293441 RepID=A0ABR5JZ19_9BACI|nr:FAD-linked oxidase C-terminal domain-containing protein [Lysinibacillus contaminans]KOS67692.1 2-hydroxy-acid oxidase [Lysinibacillus contaminans]
MTIGIEQIVNQLRNILAYEQVSTNETVRELHGRDESHHATSLPDIVVFPHSTADVSAILQIAHAARVAVVPFGVGSSLEGNAIPIEQGISIDFSKMNTILDIRPEDLLVKVQPGVTRSQLNKELKKHGLQFTVDPGADATLGGMAATNASGTTAVRYGVMRDQVRDLEVVLADGTVIHTGSLAAKSSSGYHLNGLFVGSEGTLGCFTELTLKVYGIPEFVTAGRAVFPTVGEAVSAVAALLQAGIMVGRVELVDEASMVQANIYNETSYEEKPTLFLEFHGNETGMQEDIEFATAIFEDFNCSSIAFETDNAARNKLWEARHSLAYAYIHAYPGKKLMSTDVCVPISVLAETILYARKQLDAVGLAGGLVGHVGDGNFHALLMLDPANAEEQAKADRFNEHIVQYALLRGGSCTGEHGVGIGKMKYQATEHGASLLVMKSIKAALDPHNIMNPGKIFTM